MDSRSPDRPTVVVAIADSVLLDQVLALTAVVGVEPLLLSDVSLLRQHWSAAGMVLVGVDQADRIAALGLPRRGDVYLVTEERTSAHAQPWLQSRGMVVLRGKRCFQNTIRPVRTQMA